MRNRFLILVKLWDRCPFFAQCITLFSCHRQ